MTAPEIPPCQPYLVLPPEASLDVMLDLLDAAEIACVLIRRGGLEAAAEDARIQALILPAQARDVAVLLEDDAALAATLKCDGVHLNDPAAFKAARQVLGPNSIVGVGCGGSRHDAMVASENGADYIAFGSLDPPQAPEAELIGGWQTLMTVPCLALGARNLVEVGALARAGVDFVALGPEIWDRGETGPALRKAVAALTGG